MSCAALVDRHALPDAVEPLKDLVVHLVGMIDALQGQLDAERERLRQQLAELRRRLFGPRSESLAQPGQAELAFGTVQVPIPEKKFRQVDSHRRRVPTGRPAIDESLPRRRVEHDLSEADKAQFSALERIGEEVSEMLEYVPARLEVIQHVRLKYRCERADGSATVRTAQAIASPLARGNAGPGLLAHVLASKYVDHCPLARLSRILGRQGLQVARQTLCDWTLDSAELLSVLRRLVLAGSLAETHARQALATASQLGLRRYPTRTLWPRAWELRTNLSAYDALYVALAEQLNAPLLTADTRLSRAPGLRCSVEVLEP